ncbi:hypothetical protein ACWXWU_16080 [Shewanella sp. A14]
MSRTKMSIALMLALTTLLAYATQDNTYHYEVEIGFLASSGKADSLILKPLNKLISPTS